MFGLGFLPGRPRRGRGTLFTVAIMVIAATAAGRGETDRTKIMDQPLATTRKRRSVPRISQQGPTGEPRCVTPAPVT
jgi:hypothetical protein